MRVNFYSILYVCIGLICALSGRHTYAQQSTLHNAPHLTLLSGADIVPLAGILREYSRENDVSTALTYMSPRYRMEEIAEGDVADLIITSHPLWTGQLKQMGLLDIYSITNFAGDSLAVVTMKDDKSRKLRKKIAHMPYHEALNYLMQKQRLFALVHPDVTSLGIYTAQALRKAQELLTYEISEFEQNVAPTLDERGLPEPQAALRTPVPDGRDAVSSDYFASQIVAVNRAGDVAKRVALGDGVGIMYYASAKRNDDVEIVYTIPASAHDAMIYQIAVIAGEQMGEARKMQEYLLSPDISTKLKRKGYMPYNVILPETPDVAAAAQPQ